VSDSISNSIRVLKTYTQTDERKIGYVEAAKEIIGKDGLGGLMGRGLGEAERESKGGAGGVWRTAP